MTSEIKKFSLGVQKIGMTPDNRHLYTMPDPDCNKIIKLSVSDKDKDAFEKEVSNFNEVGQKDLTVEKFKEKRPKVIASILLSGIAGIAIPGYFTRNSKALTKTVSIICGGLVGALVGTLAAFKYIMIPNVYKDAQNMKQTMKTLDIRKEK